MFRGLVYFDLSDFDYNDSIVLTGASLNLYCFKDEGDSSANPLEIGLYRMTRDWTEGNNVWDDQQNGNGATWQSCDGVNPWTSPGGDFDTNRIDGAWINDYGWFDWDCLSTVESWITGESDNYGLLLRADGGGQHLKRFRSSEYSVSSFHPYLKIEYIHKPVARICDIAPEVSNITEVMRFTGRGIGIDSNITEARWESDIDGILSTDFNFTSENLSEGIHRISFFVKDDNDLWSLPDERYVTVVNPPPPPVENLTAADRPDDDGGAIIVEWDFPGVFDFHHFAVYITDSAELGNVSHRSPEMVIEDVMVGSAQITSIGGLPLRDGDPYWVGVAAVDDRGNHLFDIEVAGPVRPLDNLAPGYIQGLFAEDTPNDQGGNITVSWTPLPKGPYDQGSNYFHHYRVYLDEAPFDSVSAMQPEVDDLTDRSAEECVLHTVGGAVLADRTDYYAAVTAVDVSGNEDVDVTCFGPVRARDNIAPGRVNDLKARDRPEDQGGAVLLEWDANPEWDVMLYNVYVSEDTFRSLGTLKPTLSVNAIPESRLTCIVDGLENAREYYFAVTAVDGGGNELREGFTPAEAVPEDNIAPPAVVDLRALDTPADNGGSLTLEWSSEPSGDFKCYMLFSGMSEPIVDISDIEPSQIISDLYNTSIAITEVGGEPLHDYRDYYFSMAVSDVNGNVNRTLAVLGPVRPVDNVPPNITALVSDNRTVIERTCVEGREGYDYPEGGDGYLARAEVDALGDTDVEIRWLIDGKCVEDGPFLNLSLSTLTRGRHTIRLEVWDTPFLLTRTINLTINETMLTPGSESELVDARLLAMAGSVLLVVVISVILVLIIVRRRRRKSKGPGARGRVKPEKEIDRKALARIHVRKKVVAVGGSQGQVRMHKSIDVKDNLYYLQDNVERQFSLKKKKYRPDEESPCPMRDSPRSEFACPRSVVEKCGLRCSQKDDLDIPQPESSDEKKEAKPTKGNRRKRPTGRKKGRARAAKGTGASGKKGAAKGKGATGKKGSTKGKGAGKSKNAGRRKGAGKGRGSDKDAGKRKGKAGRKSEGPGRKEDAEEKKVDAKGNMGKSARENKDAKEEGGGNE